MGLAAVDAGVDLDEPLAPYGSEDPPFDGDEEAPPPVKNDLCFSLCCCFYFKTMFFKFTF